MNRMEIANLFIKAAVVDRRLPINERPARLKASWFPFTHSAEDLNSRMVTNARSEQLTEGDDPFNEWMHHFWDADRMRLRPEDIADWERCNELIKLVANEGNRRALWNWAMAKAGGKEFVKWCRREGIHEMTGSRRKDRAIAMIEQHLVRGASPDNEMWDLDMLPVGPVFEHISDNIAADVPNKKQRFERDADTVFCKEAAIFDWREIRNAQRRQREAKRRQAGMTIPPANFIADMVREINGLQRPASVDVRVGSSSLFLQAIEKRVNLVKDASLQGATNTFCGVPIVEDSRVPENMAIIVQDNEIVQIIRFD